MDDLGAVCCIQSVSNLDTQFEHFFHFEPLPGDAVPERLTLEQLHGNERLAFVLLDLVDRRDIRVIEGRSSACLTLESFERLRILSQLFRKKLESHKAPQLDILGL